MSRLKLELFDQQIDFDLIRRLDINPSTTLILIKLPDIGATQTFVEIFDHFKPLFG
jgi:hypothetical protein